MARDDRGSPGGTQVQTAERPDSLTPPRTPIDLTDPELHTTGDPREAWRTLCDSAPLTFHPEPDAPGFWLVTRHDLAADVYHRPADFHPAPRTAPAAAAGDRWPVRAGDESDPTGEPWAARGGDASDPAGDRWAVRAGDESDPAGAWPLAPAGDAFDPAGDAFDPAGDAFARAAGQRAARAGDGSGAARDRPRTQPGPEFAPAGEWALAPGEALRRDAVRGLVVAATPRRLARLRAVSRSVAARLVGQAIERGACEFVEEVAARLPVAVTCEAMGVPGEDREHVHEVMGRAFGAGDPGYRGSSAARVAAARAHAELLEYYRHLAVERRERPREDVVSALATNIPADAVVRSCHALIVAGQETARHAIAGGVLALVNYPDQWDLLHDDEALVAPAVEELLRWTSPDLYGSLRATRDVTLGGETIRAGDAVLVANAAANRDGRAFARPDALDLTRAPNPHLAFGAAPPQAFAAQLVRLQLAAVLAELRRSVRQVRVVGPIARLRSNLFAGFTSLPLALDPR